MKNWLQDKSQQIEAPKPRLTKSFGADPGRKMSSLAFPGTANRDPLSMG